jgi:NADP-dependent 3-hydroxy acid dehydrogenase YdfG
MWHHVLAISRKTPRILIENKNITCLSVDLSNEADLDKGVLVEFLEKVDAIVHNAGSFMLKPLQKRQRILKMSIK